MKKIYFLVFSYALFTSCTSYDAKSIANTNENSDSLKRARMIEAVNDTANYTSIQWLDSSFQDFGKIKEGQVLEVSWRFKNNGNKPLIISNASASCGCTVAEKPEEPIIPGGEGIIKAKFDSHDRQGTQRKEVYVTANTSANQTHQLAFSVDVQKK